MRIFDIGDFTDSRATLYNNLKIKKYKKLDLNNVVYLQIIINSRTVKYSIYFKIKWAKDIKRIKILIISYNNILILKQ